MASIWDIITGEGSKYVKEAITGLLGESGIADRAKYASGLLDADSPISRDAQAWHQRTQLGLQDQLAGKDTPAAKEAYANLMNMAGNAPIGIFAGVGAKTADLAKKGLAQKMLANGDDPAKVWKETGWGIAPDGKWRFEIPDNKAFYRGSKSAGSSYAEDVMLHPEVYKAHPSLGNIRVSEFDGLGGAIDEAATKMDVGVKGNANSTALHELQHAIQQKEGFSMGGSPDDFNPKAAEQARDVLNWRREVETWMKKNWPSAKMDSETLMNADQHLRNEYGALGFYDFVPPVDVREQALSYKFKPDSPERQSMEQMVKEFGLDKKVTPDSAMTMYQRLAGEAEARLTQSRMNLDDTQRAVQYPWEPGYFKQATGVPVDGLLSRF